VVAAVARSGNEAVEVLVLQPPSPPFMDVDREFTAGFGCAQAANRSTWGHSGLPFFNHSLAVTAGVLEQEGYKLRFADAQAECWTEDVLIRLISDLRPRYLVTLVSLPSLAGDIALLRMIRERFPRTVVVASGPTCKTHAAELLSSDAADYVVTGEAETTVPELLDALKDGQVPAAVNGLVFRNGTRMVATKQRGLPRDLDSLPTVPYHLLPMARYRGKYFGRGLPVAPIIGSKGCPYECGYYCAYPLAYGRRVRFRSPERIVDEIELLNRDYGVEHFIFRDQNFTYSQPHAERVCRLIIERGLKIHWVCETRMVLVRDGALLEVMKSAGCEQINYGLETGDPDVFEGLAKPGTEFSVITEAISLTKSAGIRAHAHAIVGLPGETWSTVYNTARLLRGQDLDSVNFSFMVPIPGTRFHDDALAKGLILTNDLAKYSHAEPVVRTETMSRFELKLAQLLLDTAFGGFSLRRSLSRKMGRWLGAVTVGVTDNRERKCGLGGAE